MAKRGAAAVAEAAQDQSRSDDAQVDPFIALRDKIRQELPLRRVGQRRRYWLTVAELGLINRALGMAKNYKQLSLEHDELTKRVRRAVNAATNRSEKDQAKRYRVAVNRLLGRPDALSGRGASYDSKAVVRDYLALTGQLSGRTAEDVRSFYRGHFDKDGHFDKTQRAKVINVLVGVYKFPDASDCVRFLRRAGLSGLPAMSPRD